MQLPQSFNSDVRNGMTGRVNVLGCACGGCQPDAPKNLDARDLDVSPT